MTRRITTTEELDALYPCGPPPWEEPLMLDPRQPCPETEPAYGLTRERIPMPVSELLAVKIENCALRLRQLELAAQPILAEQRALVEQARAEVGADAQDVYSLDTKSFQAPTGPVSIARAS